MRVRAPSRRGVTLAVAVVLLGITFFGLRPPPTPGPYMRDFESYWAAGRAQNHGLDPYGRDVWQFQRTIPGVVATRDELLPFVGPPYGLPLWRPIGSVSFQVGTWIWGGVLALSLAIIGLGSLRLAGVRIDRLDVLAVAIVCAGFGPLTSGTGLGQVAIVSCAAIVAAALIGERAGWPLALVTLLAGLQPNLAIALVATVTRRRFVPLAFATLVALAVATIEPFGGIAGYLRLLGVHGAAERFIAIQTTIPGIARGFGLAAAASLALGYAFSVAVVALLTVQCLQRRRSAVERFALACAAVPLALPFSHEHDFTIVLVPALIAIRRATGATLAVTIGGTICIAVDWIGLAQRPTGVLETAGFAAASLAAYVVLARREPSARALVTGVRTLAIVPLIVVLGRLTDRLPTWPDALSTSYHADPAWTVTQVWLDEQTRSGIAALDPWWAVLRALSLAGCVIVWYAVLRVFAAERATAATVPASDSARDRALPSAEARPRFAPPSTRPRPAEGARPSF